MRRVLVPLLIVGLTAPVAATVTTTPAVASSASRVVATVAPDRVHVTQARRFAHRVVLKWGPAATGSRPTGYQVRLGNRAWRSTKVPTMQVKNLAANRSYRISIRGLRHGNPGRSVVIQVGHFR